MKEDSILKATHQGSIKIGDITISCAVLDNGDRVISERSIANSLGSNITGSYWKRRQKGGTIMPRYFYAKFLEEFIDEELISIVSNPVIYIAKNGSKAKGLPADVFPKICDVWIKAKEKGTVPKTSINVSENAYTLLKGFATIGIISLVDEATGYQDVRVKDALQQILDKYLLEEAKKYKVTFPLELYKQWFRLNGWEWKPENAQKRPGVIGKWTNKYIYERIAPNLLKELEKKNPKNKKGYREHKHFQFLTDEIGEPKLREFFGGLTALAKASMTWKKYIRLVERAYPRIGDQYDINFEDD